MPRIVECDTVVAGGGITGLYTCYKLRQTKGARHKICLFEGTSRFGGRIETVEMGGFLAEYGPMRFEKMAQPLLMGLISDMGLKTTHFAPYTAANDPDSLFDLTFDESRGAHHGIKLTALELLALGVLRLLRDSGGSMDDPRDPAHQKWWATLDEEYYRHIRTEAAFDGLPLHKMGFWNALSLVLSHRALNKILRYGTFYHIIHFNPNAAECIIFWLRGLHPCDELVGIEQGAEALIQELVRKLQAASVPLYLGHKLTNISPRPDGRVHMEVRNGAHTINAIANHVVLALPRSPLMQLRAFLPASIGDLADSVIPIPLIKCFFVNESPWWDESTPIQTRAVTTPAREVHYACRDEGGRRRGIVMVYGEPPTMHYWTPFVQRQQHLKAELNGDRRLVSGYLKYLRSNPDSTDQEALAAEAARISSFGIRDWSREPFGAGCHFWKAGVRVEDALRELSMFSLEASSSENVHICGEAYSDFQGFIEGGLRTASDVIKLI